jgi:hypothetical protein
MVNHRAICSASVVCTVILVVITFDHIYEENFLEARLSVLQTIFTSNSDAKPCIVTKDYLLDGNRSNMASRSYFTGKGIEHDETFVEDIYHGFLSNHDRRTQELKDKKKINREYEPFLYTDDIVLNYSMKGLQNLSVGAEGSFTLDTFGAVRPRSKVEFVRILFYGIAVLSPQSWKGDSNGSWTARFSIQDPGLYRVYAESVHRATRTDHFYRAIQGSPFTLLVRPASSESMSDAQVLAAMPLREEPSPAHPLVGAVRYPPLPCPDARWRPGRWLRCHHTPEPCVRTGWIWVPAACHFRIFPAAELAALPRPLWVVFAGTSVHRGTFLSAADALAQEGGANANLTSDRVWRCWGWMDLSRRGLRVSYLDLRFSLLLAGKDAALAYLEPMYTAHAIAALRALGAMAGGRGPDVFYLEAGDWPLTAFEPLLVRSWLGLGWQGRFVMHIAKPCPAADFCAERLALASEGERPAPYAWAEAHAGSGLEYADEGQLAYAFMQEQVGARRHSDGGWAGPGWMGNNSPGRAREGVCVRACMSLREMMQLA